MSPLGKGEQGRPAGRQFLIYYLLFQITQEVTPAGIDSPAGVGFRMRSKTGVLVLRSCCRELNDLGFLLPPPLRQVLEGKRLLGEFWFPGMDTQAFDFLAEIPQADPTAWSRRHATRVAQDAG